MELREAVDILKDHVLGPDAEIAVVCVEEPVRTILKHLEELNRLKELQQKGLLIELPCAIGDTVWDIRWWDDFDESVIVDGKKYFRRVSKHKVTKKKFDWYDFEGIGKNVFLTKEEAEEACKKKNAERGC